MLMAKVNPGHYLIGVEGLALLRRWLLGDNSAAAARIAEIERFIAELDHGRLSAAGFEIPELDAAAGYEAWAPTYDELANPLIRIEQPAVRAMIDQLGAGRALDAACGTGRHTAYLVERGFDTVGIDGSPAMLERARAKLPAVRFERGDLSALPVEDGGFDLVLCALALHYCAELGRPIRELARVVRPGGRIIVSEFHPFNLLCGGGSLFQGKDGRWGIITAYYHRHADYFSAFIQAGLEVRRCVEIPYGVEEAAIIGGPLFRMAPEAFRETYVGMPGALIWEVARPSNV